MSNDYSTIRNKQQNHPGLYFKKFLRNSGEPKWDVSGYLPAELEAELLDSSYDMRKRFRYIAQGIRNRYL